MTFRYNDTTLVEDCPRQLKPRPHEQQCRSNIVECYKSNESFDKVECCFDKFERCFDIVARVDGALLTYRAL